jgi:hypothetical protein
LIARFGGWAAPFEISKDVVFKRALEPSFKKTPARFHASLQSRYCCSIGGLGFSIFGQLKCACGQSVVAVISVEVAHAIASP